MTNEPLPEDTSPPPPPGTLTPASPTVDIPAGAVVSDVPPARITDLAPTPPTPKAPVKTPPPPHDSFREFIETIVFVVVLVLILKTFLAEAFVIPTGSMATTLLGYHKDVTCLQCKYQFQVNTSKEADPAEAGFERQIVIRCICPNCQFKNDLEPQFFNGGKR